MPDSWVDFDFDDEIEEVFVGPCTCLHDEEDHDWGGCFVLDNLLNECPCEAGWTDQ